MRFYLGTHEISWLTRIDVPLCISRRRLDRYERKRPYRPAVVPWVLDSGAFSELTLHGKWTITPRQYISQVETYMEQIGKLVWAAPQDWMCEPHLIAKTGLTVNEHQWRTVENYMTLRALAPHLPFIPVLQGWTLEEYQQHAQMYLGSGIDLRTLPTVGIGSVCRRQQTQGGKEVIEYFADYGLNLHAFGLKTNGLRAIGHLLQSSDSMAWSYRSQFRPPLPECTHKKCNNCMRYALAWRDKVLKLVA